MPCRLLKKLGTNLIDPHFLPLQNLLGLREKLEHSGGEIFGPPAIMELGWRGICWLHPNLMEKSPFYTLFSKSSFQSQSSTETTTIIKMTLLCSCTKLRFICSLSGTVIRNIWMRILLVVLFTSLLCILHTFVDAFRAHKSQSSTNLNVLGTVTALLLAFRTNTAYDRYTECLHYSSSTDSWCASYPHLFCVHFVSFLSIFFRYWEGRKLWSTVTHNIRSLTRLVSIVVPETNVEDRAEKISIVNLLVAFPFAVKNYLREDYSYESPDLKELLSRVPHFVPTHAGVGEYGHDPLANGIPSFHTKQYGITIEPMMILDRVKATLKLERQLSSTSSRKETFRAHAEPTETNIPLEILCHFTAYVDGLATMEKPLSTTFLNQMNAGKCQLFKMFTQGTKSLYIHHSSFFPAVTSLSDTLSGLERILQTPIPFAYAVHLEHVVWIYLLALPYQLIFNLDWWTIPVMAFGSFCLLGILDIASEIENPFGTDYNDLVSQD